MKKIDLEINDNLERNKTIEDKLNAIANKFQVSHVAMAPQELPYQELGLASRIFPTKKADGTIDNDLLIQDQIDKHEAKFDGEILESEPLDGEGNLEAQVEVEMEVPDVQVEVNAEAQVEGEVEVEAEADAT